MSEEKRGNYALDALLMNELRFFIMTVLSMYEDADFQFLKSELGATDGNLSAQLKKLENENYLDYRKEFVGRKPRTSYRITPLGLQRLKEHLERMKRIGEKIENRKSSD